MQAIYKNIRNMKAFSDSKGSKSRVHAIAFCVYLASLLIFGSNGILAAGVSLASSQIVFFRMSLGAAILAKHFEIPFYIAVPTSSIDFSIPRGSGIKIEERPGSEIYDMWYREPMAPENVQTYNPAFDVTDNSLISGIITEYGVIRPPYNKTMRELRKTIKAEEEKAKEARGRDVYYKKAG